MTVKAYQTKNLSILFAEVLEEEKDCCGGGCREAKSWFVRNPMSLQLVPNQNDPTGQELMPRLFPVFYTQIMLVDDYDIEFSSCDYVDVTERFPEAFFENYRQLNSKPEAPSEGVAEDNVVSIKG